MELQAELKWFFVVGATIGDFDRLYNNIHCNNSSYFYIISRYVTFVTHSLCNVDKLDKCLVVIFLSPLISDEDCLRVSANANLLAPAKLSVLEITLDFPSPS